MIIVKIKKQQKPQKSIKKQKCKKSNKTKKAMRGGDDEGHTFWDILF